jgi:hypothetical protein
VTGQPHPPWCTGRHQAHAEHRSAPLLVLLPFREQVTAVLAEDVAVAGALVVEIVLSDQDAPATHPLDTNTVAWLIVPASHVAQLAGALSELATLATTGGTR